MATDGKNAVWLNVALKSPDQLRQRVAWALAQVFVIGEGGVGGREQHEVYNVFYDVFVRHAFGSYRDIMQEVAYSPAMATYLTYLNGKSLASSGSFPDENFARELMQLFTVGLSKLNADGTPKVNEAGAIEQVSWSRPPPVY